MDFQCGKLWHIVHAWDRHVLFDIWWKKYPSRQPNAHPPILTRPEENWWASATWPTRTIVPSFQKLILGFHWPTSHGFLSFLMKFFQWRAFLLYGETMHGSCDFGEQKLCAWGSYTQWDIPRPRAMFLWPGVSDSTGFPDSIQHPFMQFQHQREGRSRWGLVIVCECQPVTS